MVAAGNIPKPSFWTFYFYKQLKLFGENCVYRDDDVVVVKNDKGYAGILWNIDGDDTDVQLSFELPEGEYTLITKTVDEECCNPLKVWHDMGEPAYPSKDETELIRSSSYPLVQSSVVSSAGGAKTDICVRKNGVVYFTLTKRELTSDRGYDYDRVVNFH